MPQNSQSLSAEADSAMLEALGWRIGQVEARLRFTEKRISDLCVICEKLWASLEKISQLNLDFEEVKNVGKY